MLVVVVLERRAVHRIGSAFNLNVDDRTARQTLLGVKAVCGHVDGLNRFERGHVGRI